MSGGDPGSKPVNLLKRHGYAYVVLPTETLRTGVVQDSILNDPDNLVARVRMYDCMEVLSA